MRGLGAGTGRAESAAGPLSRAVVPPVLSTGCGSGSAPPGPDRAVPATVDCFCGCDFMAVLLVLRSRCRVLPVLRSHCCGPIAVAPVLRPHCFPGIPQVPGILRTPSLRAPREPLETRKAGPPPLAAARSQRSTAPQRERGGRAALPQRIHAMPPSAPQREEQHHRFPGESDRPPGCKHSVSDPAGVLSPAPSAPTVHREIPVVARVARSGTSTGRSSHDHCGRTIPEDVRGRR